MRIVGDCPFRQQRKGPDHGAPPNALALRLLLVVVLAVAHNNIQSVHGDVQTSKFLVHIPQSLAVKGGYDHRDALFGIPPYGGSIQEKVYYANNTLCESSVDTLSGFPVEKDDKGNRQPWQSPYIVMVDRGECTFVQKVRNAQRAGAAAVIIADSVCLCGTGDCDMAPDQQVCETQEPIMADDGSGADISIPSFLLFKQDADKIKAVLYQNQPVRVEMSFSVPAPDSRVEYDLWSSPGDEIAKPFLKSFWSAVAALGDDAFFTPHEYIYDGTLAGCHDAMMGGDTFCGDLCTNAGRYCATDPDGDLDTGVSGADVVTESLRRICVWNTYGKDNGVGTEWWKYVQEFMFRCNDPEKPGYFSKDDCIQDAMTHAGVDKKKIDQCMTDSGGLKEDEENSLLDASITAKEASGAFLIPSMFVNKAPLRGELAFNVIFRAICAGFASGSEPEVCEACATCHDEEACVKDGACKTGYEGGEGGQTPSGVSPALFGVSMVGITLLFSIAGYIIYKRQQRAMREEVRGMLAQYMPIDSKNNNEDTAVSEFTMA